MAADVARHRGEQPLRVVSPDGRWLFDGDRIRGGGIAEQPEVIDFFERWTLWTAHPRT